MKVKNFETVYGVVLVVMEEDGMLSFYGKHSSSNLLFLVGYSGSIEEVDNDVAATIAAQYESLISEEEEAIDEALEETIASSEANEETKPVEFRKELVWLMVRSVTTNLELCACTNKDTKQYCEMLMDKLDEAYNNDDIEEVDKLLGMIQKLLLENNII